VRRDTFPFIFPLFFPSQREVVRRQGGEKRAAATRRRRPPPPFPSPPPVFPPSLVRTAQRRGKLPSSPFPPQTPRVKNKLNGETSSLAVATPPSFPSAPPSPCLNLEDTREKLERSLPRGPASSSFPWPRLPLSSLLRVGGPMY